MSIVYPVPSLVARMVHVILAMLPTRLRKGALVCSTEAELQATHCNACHACNVL